MVANGISFTLLNNCQETIWPAVSGNMDSQGERIEDPLPRGLALGPFQSFRTPSLPLPWSGRIWARQHCSSDGTNCVLGDCSRSSCWGVSAKNVTLAEITALANALWYNLSLGE